MDFLTIVYLAYGFLALYILILYSLIYLQNRTRFSESPPIKKQFSLSIVVPCYNAKHAIGETIQSLLNLNYKGLKKIIVVDDCSTDNSYKIAKSFQRKYPGKVKVVRTPKNTGRAAGAKNFGAKFARTDLIGFTDDDSRPKRDAVSHMIGYFNDSKVGGVTSRVLVQNRKSFLGRLQSFEYKIIAFTRKILGFVDAIYVTNGPLSIYTRKAFREVGGFSMANWTEDIEITWHMVAKGYKINMAIPAKVHTVVPNTLKAWFRQRLRWNVGGLQTIVSYKKSFLRCGMLGFFILPYFVLSWALALFGLLVLIYRFGRTLIIRYLATKMSIESQTAILTLRDINLTPGVLLFFGILLFALGLTYNLFALSHSRDEELGKEGFSYFFVYMFVYLTLYPIILVTSIYKYIKGYNKW